MTAGDQRDSVNGRDAVRDTETGRTAAEEETIPPAHRVGSNPAPKTSAGNVDLPSRLGRYEVTKCLGRGAMGAVFLAHDTELDRKVALKVPLGDTSEGSEWLERFRREARAAGALRHANICPIFDVAEIDGFHLIAMAFVEGSPLSEIIASGKQIPVRRAVQIVRKIASALADAHEQRIVHRDLKPANIMIDGKGEPIVMDFGLARHVAVPGSEQLTREGDVAGSPAYMSPEQFEGRAEAIGPGSDIYSLGVILFELLTGEIPFRGSMIEIMAQILKKSVPAPSTLREGVDEKLDQICRKMTARKEANRFGSMKSVVKALTEYLKADTESRSAQVSVEASTEEDLEQINRACRKADRLVDEYKYEEAIKVLSGLPERLKTSRVRDLLLDATDLKQQFDRLLVTVEKDLVTYEHPNRLFRKARRLMQLRPNHRRAKEIFAEVSGANSRLPLRIRRSWQKGQFYVLAGRTVHLSVLVGIFLGVTGAVTAALLSLVFFVPTEDGLVQIELADPTLSVKVDGNTFTVENLNSPLKFSTGDHKLIIEQNGRQVSSSDFTITEGDTVRLRVALLAGDLILENNGVRTTLPMGIPSRPPPDAVTTVEGTAKSKPSRVPGKEDPSPIPKLHRVELTKPPVVAQSAPNVPADSLSVCEKLSTNSDPVGLHPEAAPFASETSSQNGFQLRLPGWKAWSANDWQFDFRYTGTEGRGFYLIQPMRFGHLTLLLKRDNCGLYGFTEWPERSPSPHPSVKLSGFDQMFPLKPDQSYRISSRVDEAGSYLLSIDGQPVLKALFPPIREYIVDGKAVGGLPKGPVRPLVFRSAARLTGDGLIKKWPPGSGGLVIDNVVNGHNEATGIRVVQTAPTTPNPVADSLSEGLVAWYPLDNVQGRDVVDSSGNNHNAVATGDLKSVSGMLGGGVEMDADTLLPIGEVAGFEWNEPFTFCAWIRPFSLSGARYIFRKRNDDTSKGYTMMLRRETLGFGAVNKGGSNMLGMYADKGAIILRHWSHVAIVYDGTGRKLSVAMYVDGRQVRYENTSGTLSASITVSDPLRIGHNFVGQLDDLRIYNRMLSNEEVSFLAAPDRN